MEYFKNHSNCTFIIYIIILFIIYKSNADTVEIKIENISIVWELENKPFNT